MIDLSGAFGRVPLALGPGRRASVVLGVLNAGNVPAAGLLTVTLRATQDPAGASGLTPLVEATRPVKIGPGRRRPVALSFLPPSELTPGTYYLFASVDTGGVFAETNEGNNGVVSQGTVTLG